MTEQEKQLQIRIRELEKEVSRLHAEIKKNSETQYGLRWMDVPEAFENASENSIPILEEVKEKTISNDDEKPTHIIIEGDNFHALTCLNYTHKGKIDVIYIDPPYNTGSDGFTYKDKRFLKEFPDGTIVPNNHPLRHSYWLSFMQKRLELAKNLLSERGVIFISIDDNEQANLKLLCDNIFGENNFESFIWKKKGGASNTERILGCLTEYILCFFKKKKAGNFRYRSIERNYKFSDEKGGYNLEGIEKTNSGIYKRPTMLFPIIDPKTGKKFYPKNGMRWTIGEKNIKLALKNEKLFFNYKTNKVYYIKREEDYKKSENVFYNILLEHDSLAVAKDELEEILDNRELFDTPKPLALISHLISLTSIKNPTILDFFAGSGTTMHATMQLNEEDGGHRQCILVQQNENNICENVTYERNRRVIQGYTNTKGKQVAGLGNSMKYYKTAFVGKNTSRYATDTDRMELSLKAGYLLALGENTLEEIKTTQSYQIFTDKHRKYTAVYFIGNLSNFADFVNTIETIQKENEHPQIAIYIFCWGAVDIYENEFDNLLGITLKPIPQPILDIYKSINA